MKNVYLTDYESAECRPLEEADLYKNNPLLTRIVETGSIRYHLPELSKSKIQDKIDQLRKHHMEILAHLKISEILNIIDQVVEQWVDPNSKWRKISSSLLPESTGYNQEMIDSYLIRFFKGFRKEKLLKLLDSNFSNSLVLDEFRPDRIGGLSRAYGPEVVTHVFSGNVPGLPIWSLICGLLVKSGNLGKVSSSEPLMPYLFARSFYEIAPQIGTALSIVYWKGGEDEVELTAFSEVEAVIAYGSDKTIAEVRSKIPPHVKLLQYGHKVSLAIISREALDPHRIWDTAHRLANDIAMFDQQGCVAPHTVFVEEDADVSPQSFCSALSREMENFQHKWPRSPLSLEESNAIQKMRAAYELKLGAVEVHTSKNSTAWTVICCDLHAFPLSPLNRFIHVVPIKDITMVPKRLSSLKYHVQTAGVAVPPRRLRELTGELGKFGVSRICPIGKMSFPDPGWHHDGGFSLLELVRWTDVESATELEMEKYDPYRD